MSGLRKYLAGVTLLAALLAGCAAGGPAEIHYGSDECAHCRMMITDPTFAAQMVTATGKSVKFDAIECMGRYRGEHSDQAEGASFWVNDFNRPGTWLSLEEAVLIRSEAVRSPMGAGLLALNSEEAARRHLEEYPGERTNWEAVSR